MIRHISLEQEVEMRLEFRHLYADLGYPEILQVLYELLKSSEILAEVIKEEIERE